MGLRINNNIAAVVVADSIDRRTVGREHRAACSEHALKVRRERPVQRDHVKRSLSGDPFGHGSRRSRRRPRRSLPP